MRLQQLDIFGFKSFSDRAQLAFDRGVTAIVGPNGCGKSNLADAITWVLGEQSAKSLRGDRMEDVIFSGSDARKPTATAEVRAMFADVAVRASVGNGNGNGNREGAGNANWEAAYESPLQTRSLEITRRLYRSGESEYLIDGEICRLRDVHELLMDTGLGAKAYAIIEQGKIGLILSSRPADRRQLIEEAAGVTKYKARRRTAELKLEASQQNLTRIADIIFEIEKQVDALKRQAAKARRYKRLRDELRQWEKLLFARRYWDLAQTIDAVRAKLETARGDEAAAAVALSAVEVDLGRIRIDVAEAEASATRAREAVHAQELETGRWQQQIQLDEQQVRQLESRAAELTAELATLEARHAPGLVDLAEHRAAAARATADRGRAESLLVEGEAEHAAVSRRIEGLEADVEAARAEVFAALNAATALRHAVEHAGVSREKVNEQLSKLGLELAEIAREVERVNDERAAASDARRRAQIAGEATSLARNARESELASARIELERRTRAMRAADHDVAALSARFASLEELDSARAGYTDSAKMLLAQANGRVQQQGSVADCLDVEPPYERAVEACLGDLLQYVIVPRTENALTALQIVSEAHVGRCGVVIVEPEQVAGDRRQAKEQATGNGRQATAQAASGLVPIHDVLRIPGAHGSAIRAAIGEAWIADTLETALAAARKIPVPIATLSGEVIRGPSVISGGAGDEARGILTVKGEIKELRDRIVREREGLVACTAEVAALETSIAQLVSGIGALDAEQHGREKAILALELQVQRATEDAERLQKKCGVVDTERRSAEEERRVLDARQAEARHSIARLEQEQHAADERLAFAQRRLLEAREMLETFNHRVADAKASHAVLSERAAALADDVRRLEETVAEIDARVSGCRRNALDIQAQRETLGNAILGNKGRLDADVATLEALREQVRTAEDLVMALRADTDAREGSVREARRSLEGARSIVAALDLDRTKAESHVSHLAGSCLDTVQATLDEVLVEVQQAEANGTTGALVAVAIDSTPIEDGAEEPEDGQDSAPEPSPEARIANLRAKIDGMGAVNMMAIEQFDELSRRHTFLLTQQRDLIESIVSTGETIRRIDETTRQRFRDAFNTINSNFQETFSALFGGGRAGLTLLDETDVLETSIEIIAQPPGKRLQNVQLLSGGEKALTAIALMFAIFKYKPSPFCLLDEIDAPLDDANIGRFVEMLKGMLQHTQFILITHNRKTMEIADRLYGVTMEEPGVSKLISLRLN
jgi:chromosome segregation protein